MADLLLDGTLSAAPTVRRPRAWRASLRRYSLAAAVFLAVVAFLQWGVPARGVPSYLMPTPTSVVARAFDPQSDLLHHLWVTTQEALGGLLLGSMAGFLLAVLFVHVPPVEDALYPWAVVSQTVPMIAIAQLLVLWFGNGTLPRAMMSAVIAFFPILVNTTRGLRQADRATMALLRSYAATPWQIFWEVRLRSSLPFLFTGLKIGSTLSVIGAIVGEFAGAGEGLGYVITVSGYHLDTDLTFAAVAAASLLGIVMYLALKGLERWIVFWQETA